MKKNICLPLSPVDLEWEKLSETKKAQVLLNSSRLLDNDEFLNDFTSWEFPQITSVTQVKDTDLVSENYSKKK